MTNEEAKAVPHCDRCNAEIPGVAHNEPMVGLEGTDYATTHVAIGWNTITVFAAPYVHEDDEWEPQDEYDLCDKCANEYAKIVGEWWHKGKGKGERK